MRRRLVPLAALALLALAGPASAAHPRAGGAYLVVRPVHGHVLTLFDRPNGHVIARSGRSAFGGPLAVGVVRRAGRWLAVSTETVPNGRVAWVDTHRLVAVTRVRLAIRVHLGGRRLEVVRDGRVVHRFTVAVGASGSPTPTGRFAVAEKLPGPRFGAAYGCCILGLTAHQPHPPAGWDTTNSSYFIAIHGGGGVGSAVSAGCLHLPDAELRYLMRVVPLGAPVFVGR